MARLLGAFSILLAAAGCTPAEAAPWGKVMFGFMIAALIVIPAWFMVTWRRRRQ